MTYKEKLKQIHPEAMNDKYTSGCKGCPSDYGWPDLPEAECNLHISCTRCWNREIPGTEADPIFIMGDKDMGVSVDNEGYTAWMNGKATGTIKDSGERRQFDTGAVRDIQEGKGRCDLMPLDVVGEYYHRAFGDEDPTWKTVCPMAMFKETGDPQWLELALIAFVDESNFTSHSDMFLEVAKHFEEGAKKYGENNWQKGIPVRCYIDSAVRHYLKHIRGDKDEPHDRAFCWNILCAIWTCKHKPDLNDYARKDGDDQC